MAGQANPVPGGVVTIPLPTPFPMGASNVFLLKGDPVTLVDTGTLTEDAWQALITGLRGHGLEVADIERVFLTHHHVDHTGLLARIMDVSDAESCGHPNLLQESRIGDGNDEGHKVFYRQLLVELGTPDDIADDVMVLWDAFKSFIEPFHVDCEFQDGEQTGPFRTYFVPGHSSTDTLLVNEAEGYTIVGDHILENINPNPLLRRPLPGHQRESALVQYRDSLARSHSLDLGLCLPGHGDPFPDHRAVIDGIRTQLQRREDRIVAYMTDAGVTVHEIARLLDPKLALPNMYLGLSVAAGQLEVLEVDGRVAMRPESGVLRYYPASGGRATTGA